MGATIWKTGTSNAVITTLSSSITSTSTTVPLTSSTGLQSPGVIVVDRLDANDEETPLIREYISFTGISGDSLTGCVRTGLGGSTAQTHSSGANVEEIWSVDHWNDFLSTFDVEHDSDGTHDDTIIALLTATQTFTNKTLTSPVINTPTGDVATKTGTQTLTNKRITKRVVTTTDDATAVIDTDITDVYELSAVANATVFTLTGTPTDGQTLVVRILDAGVTKGLTWTGFTAIGVTLPTDTTAGKWHYVGCMYNKDKTAWHAIAVVEEA